MGYFRVINRKHYDSERNHFSSLALDLSRHEPISVVHKGCAIAESGGICEHIARYYREQTGEPPIYWDIPEDAVPTHCRFKQERSTTGDDCHHNLHGWAYKEARRKLFSLKLEEFTVCDQDGERPLEEADVE